MREENSMQCEIKPNVRRIASYRELEEVMSCHSGEMIKPMPARQLIRSISLEK